MYQIIQDPKVKSLSKSMGQSILENDLLLKDIIIYYEKRTWANEKAALNIDGYLKKMMKFRAEHMYQETKHIFQ